MPVMKNDNVRMQRNEVYVYGYECGGECSCGVNAVGRQDGMAHLYLSNSSV
jgi:hypothetical protein